MAAGSPESSLLRGDRRIFKPPSQEACSIKQDASAAFSQTNLLAAGQGPATRACFLKKPNGNFLIKHNFKIKPHHGIVKGKLVGSSQKYLTHRPLWKHGKMKYSAGRGALGYIQGTETPVCSPGTHLHELWETSAHSTVTRVKVYSHDFCPAEQGRRLILRFKGAISPVPGTSGTWKSHCRARLAPLLQSASQSKAKPVCNWKAL